MRKGILSVSVGLVAVLLAMTTIVWGQEDVNKSPTCIYCDMDRTKYAHSRMLVTYDDGTQVGTCSIHCLAIDLTNNYNKTPVRIEVGDYISRLLIDAEKAYWVLGGSRPGVMTTQGKWAFAHKIYAEKFIREHGGTLATFDDAMKAAYESMYTHTKIIREKRMLMKAEEKETKEAK